MRNGIEDGTKENKTRETSASYPPRHVRKICVNSTSVETAVAPIEFQNRGEDPSAAINERDNAKPGTYSRLPNGQVSLLAPSLWKTMCDGISMLLMLTNTSIVALLSLSWLNTLEGLTAEIVSIRRRKRVENHSVLWCGHLECAKL